MVALVIGVYAGAGFECSGSWVVLLACLWTTAACALGVDNARQMCRDLVSATPPSGHASGAPWTSAIRIPVTDRTLDLTVANKFANSCQVREKGLKIVQYILKTVGYCGLFSAGVAKAAKGLSKTTSIARRFFKFARWIKHFEDFAEAHDEKSAVMRALLYVRLGANIGADWAEDVCSLERIGFLPKGTLSVEFMLFAEYCQLVLALVEIFVTSVRAHAEQLVTEATVAIGDAKTVLKQTRKLTMVRLELIKFVSDVGKALFDCELSFAHEGIFIGCSLFSAVVSTHKNMVKVLK